MMMMMIASTGAGSGPVQIQNLEQQSGNYQGLSSVCVREREGFKGICQLKDGCQGKKYMSMGDVEDSNEKKIHTYICTHTYTHTHTHTRKVKNKVESGEERQWFLEDRKVHDMH